MIEYGKARELVLERIRSCGIEDLPTDAARGRVLAGDLTARTASPPFNKSAMDGYAVRQEDVRELPAELEVAGEVFAGQSPEFAVGPGQAAVITTGAPVPEGADMVVMVEHTERTEEGAVRVFRLSGGNICAAGEDVAEGQTVLEAGQLLTPLRVGMAAAAGYAQVPVRRLPTAALLCTGSEVVEPGEEPPEGKIFNANGPMLAALMKPLCEEVCYLGIAGDARQELATKVNRAMEADVAVITGGVSMGQYDLVPEVLQEAGVEEVFHKVAIKPGKPTFFGTCGGTLVFGMPGNPQSCFVIFHVLVAGALAAIAGRAELPPLLKEAVAADGFPNKPERMSVKPGRLRQTGGRVSVRPQPYHGSADIVGPSGADCYFIVPRGAERVNEGETLECFEI